MSRMYVTPIEFQIIFVDFRFSTWQSTIIKHSRWFRTSNVYVRIYVDEKGYCLTGETITYPYL